MCFFFHYNSAGAVPAPARNNSLQKNHACNWQQLREKLNTLQVPRTFPGEPKTSPPVSNSPWAKENYKDSLWKPQCKSMLLPRRMGVPLAFQRNAHKGGGKKLQKFPPHSFFQEKVAFRDQPTAKTPGDKKAAFTLPFPEGTAKHEKNESPCFATDISSLIQGSTLLVATSCPEEACAILESCTSPTLFPVGGLYDMIPYNHLDIQRWVALYKQNTKIHSTLCSQLTHWQKTLVAVPTNLLNAPPTQGKRGGALYSLGTQKLVSLLYVLQKPTSYKDKSQRPILPTSAGGREASLMKNENAFG